MEPIDLHLLNAEAKFKEAINHAFDLGWEASEERTIKLLKEHHVYYDDEGFDVCSKCGRVFIAIENHLIALIKGESNE